MIKKAGQKFRCYNVTENVPAKAEDYNSIDAVMKKIGAKCIIINVGSSFFFPILTFTSFIFGIGNVLDGSKLEYWNERIGYSILNYYIYDNVWSAGWTFIGFIITIFVVYQIVRRWIFNKLDIKKALVKNMH